MVDYSIFASGKQKKKKKERKKERNLAFATSYRI